jgi:hypothetical protein
MNDLRSLLQQHDPGRAAAFPAPEFGRIREAVVTAAERRASFTLLRPLVATVMSLLVLMSITFAVVHRPAEPASQQRRIEYTTRGGTRIIWTIDPAFKM